MNSFSRSILARSLMTSVASLAFMTMGAAVVRAEIVIVQGDDGAAGEDGVNPGDPGGDGEPVAASAGSVHPITAPLNTATATGGNGGQGGNGVDNGEGGDGEGAALPLHPRRRPSSPARRKRTPILSAAAAVLEGMRSNFLATVAQGAAAGALQQRVPRRIRMPAPSSAGRQQQVGKEVRAAPTATSAMAAEEGRPELLRQAAQRAVM